jgi:hypothetical protein
MLQGDHLAETYGGRSIERDRTTAESGRGDTTAAAAT